LASIPVDRDDLAVALSRFAERLKVADALYRGPNQRIGIIGAVAATQEFLRSVPELADYIGPFVKLVHGLHAIDDGIVPSLFRVDRLVGRPYPLEDKTLAGMSGCALQILIEIKYPKMEAAALIARKLTAIGVSIGNKGNTASNAAAKTICFWRDRAKKGDRIIDDDARIYYDFLVAFRPQIQALVDAGRPRDAIRTEFLNGDHTLTKNAITLTAGAMGTRAERVAVRSGSFRADAS